MNNFTTLDALGAMRAAFGFLAILFAPGYLIAYAADLFRFRSRLLLERIAWSIALSFGVSPVVAVLLSSIFPLGGTASGFALAGAACVALLVYTRRSQRILFDRPTLLLAVFLLFGAALVIAELVDIQRGQRLFLSVTVLDQAFRVAFIDAITHTGIPPQNPLYHPGAAAPLRYYYFWYALCAVCMKLAHVTARQALIASSIWSGIGLSALISLFARHFLGIRDRLRRFILVAVLLLCVTGLDLLPVLYNLFVNHDFSGDLEWWSSDQIASWLDTILWVPNHLAALLACLTAFLLLWRLRASETLRRDSQLAIVLAGTAAASAFGLSVYVAAGFAMLMVAWSVREFLRTRDITRVWQFALAVVTAVVLLFPYLRELTSAHSGTEHRGSAGVGHLFQVGVRQMIAADTLTDLPAMASLHRLHPILLDQAVRLVLLLPGYALELGFFGAILVLALAGRRRLDEPRRAALFLTVTSLILVSFVRSAVIGNNDFGYRAALIPSFFLLLLAADRLTLSSQPKTLGPLLGGLLVLGVAGSAFQALMLRVYVPLHVAARMPGFAGLPESAFAARTAYAEAALTIPPTAIVQPNLIDPGNYFYVANMLYAQRAMASDAAVDCGAVFGGDPFECGPTQQAIRALFVRPSVTAEQARSTCRSLGIDFLAASSSDPAWTDRAGWVWILPDAVPQTQQSPSFRIVSCGEASQAPTGSHQTVP